MNETELTIPEGFFEKNLAVSLERSRRIRRRRAGVAGAFAVLALAGGIWSMGSLVTRAETERMIMAEASAMSELDIFLMVNGE